MEAACSVIRLFCQVCEIVAATGSRRSCRSDALRKTAEEEFSMIPVVKAKLLEGKRGPHRRHRQREFDRLGLRQGLPRVRRRTRSDLPERQGQEIRRPAGARARSADRHAARCQCARANGGRVRTHHQGVGQARLRRPLHRVLAEGGAAGPRRRRVARRLPQDHGSVLLDLHPHGASRRAADAQRRHAVHDDATTAARWW